MKNGKFSLDIITPEIIKRYDVYIKRACRNTLINSIKKKHKY